MARSARCSQRTGHARRHLTRCITAARPGRPRPRRLRGPGRAAAYASALACNGDAVIEVPPGTPVSALTMGDKSLLVPGAMVAISMISRARRQSGHTAGLIVENATGGDNAAMPRPPNAQAFKLNSLRPSETSHVPCLPALLAAGLLVAIARRWRRQPKLGKWGVDLTSHG